MRPARAMAVMGISLIVVTCTSEVTIGGNNLTHTFITDSPFPYHRIARVDLYVVSVSASMVPDTSPGSTGFFTLATPARKINVLALQNGLHDELGVAVLPEGRISAVRMVIDTDSSSLTLRSGAVLTGTSTPGIDWQSSAGRPTLNALINDTISVTGQGGLVVIDYDVGQAFIPVQELDPSSTDSGFIFSPVLRAVDANRSGWITGTVLGGSNAGSPVVDASLRLYLGDPADAENTWSMLGTAKTATDGRFRFASVTRSAYWEQLPAHAGETYIVTIDPPPGSGLTRRIFSGLSVSAASETALGQIVLP